MPYKRPRFKLDMSHMPPVTTVERKDIRRHLIREKKIPEGVTTIVGQKFMQVSRSSFRTDRRIGMGLVLKVHRDRYYLNQAGEIEWSFKTGKRHWAKPKALKRIEGGQFHLFDKLQDFDVPGELFLPMIVYAA